MTDEEQTSQPPAVAHRRQTPPNTHMAKPVPRGKAADAGSGQQSDPLVEAPVRPARRAQPSPEPPEPPAVVEPAPVEPADASRPTPPPLPLPRPVAPPEPSPAPPEQPAAPAAAPALPFPDTVRATLQRVDQAWLGFRAAAMRFPAERMDERLSEGGWTRKQMLAHIATWHDLTADRLIKLINTGSPVELGRETDAVNAGAARQAIGKTAGEVLKDMEATFNRLRRQMERLSDSQLRIGDWWAAQIIAANTYEHYDEHRADIYVPEPQPGSGARG